MVNRKVILNYGGKKITLELKEMRGPFKEAFGLMFCRREKAKALLFPFKNSINFTIHSFFVFFEFIAIWVDEKGKIIEIRKIIPWKFNIRPKKKFIKLIEIPINDRYKNIIKLLDED